MMAIRNSDGCGYGGQELTRREVLKRYGRITGGAAAMAIAPGLLGGMAGKARAQMNGCDYLTSNWSENVRAMLAERGHRLHHLVWHLTRNSWHNLSIAQIDAVRETEPKWVPPRPSILKAKWDERTYRTQNGRWATANGSGVDFLYFHREMIAMVDRALEAEGKDRVASWSDQDKIPPPAGGCADEAVAEAWEFPDSDLMTRRLRQVKSDAFYWDRMAWWEQTYTDQARLRTLTLGELGSRIEVGVHNNMHLRWSAQSWNPDTGEPGPAVRDEGDLRDDWNDPRYNSLLDEFAAHVNPLFWRLHKWVDNRINDWAESHGEAVERYTTNQGFEWFKPGPWVEVEEPWVGGFHHNESPDDDNITVMENVVRIITEPDVTLAAAVGPTADPPPTAVTLRDLLVNF